MLSLVVVNGLANRLRALRTAIEFFRPLSDHEFRFAWPFQPGVCEVAPEVLFDTHFLEQFLFEPTKAEKHWLNTGLRLGFHFYQEMEAWALLGGRLTERPFQRAVHRELIERQSSGWLISGGNFRSQARPQNFLKSSLPPPDGTQSKIVFSRECMEIMRASDVAKTDVAVHLRLGNYGRQLPSPAALHRRLERDSGTLNFSRVTVVADGHSKGADYLSMLNSKGFETISSPRHFKVDPSVIDFFWIAQARIIYATHWSSFSEEAVKVGTYGGRVIRLKVFFPYLWFRAIYMLKIVKEFFLLGSAVQLQLEFGTQRVYHPDGEAVTGPATNPE